jgi:hypothetical protein
VKADMTAILTVVSVLGVALLALIFWMLREILWKLEAIRREIFITNREFHDKELEDW